jgi:hypothetical protein
MLVHYNRPVDGTPILIRTIRETNRQRPAVLGLTQRMLFRSSD